MLAALSSSIQHMWDFFSSFFLSLPSFDLKPLHCIDSSLRLRVSSIFYCHCCCCCHCHCHCRCYDYYYFCYDYLSSICGNNKVLLVSFFFLSFLFFPIFWLYLVFLFLPALFDAAFSFIFMFCFWNRSHQFVFIMLLRKYCSIKNLFIFTFFVVHEHRICACVCVFR